MRTSSVHYIVPSAISITPNNNSSANDVSVYIARGAKINVHSPGAGIDYVDAQVQTWSLRGRNRRLADIGKPYTIYARLSKTDHQNGYLVFAPKNPNENEWSDKYNYITKDGLSSISNAITSADYWYVRMGDVSLPDNGKRTITIDTGILGTDLYNSNWELSADGLPLQVGIQCTIEGTDAGSTPYVRWDKTVDLAAVLCKGWNSNIISRAHTWSLSRNTGHPNADAAWPDETRAAAFSQSGQIALLHTRGDDDDFCGSMSATFTITAWGTDLELGLVKLATGSVTIMAETVEKYELVLSSLVVNYNPISGAYSPPDGVLVTIRATDQQGNVYKLSRDQISYMGLSAYYSPSDIDATVSLSFADGGNAVGVAVIPVSAFSLQKSMNVRLLNADYHELSSANIAFVKDGEDTREREWIFLRSEMAIDFGGPDSDHPAPHVIEYGEVNPEGAAGAIDDDDNQEGWVPEGWYDEMSGADETYRYEYSSYRDFVHDEELGDHWGTFTRPSIWDRWDAGGASYRCRWTLDGKDVWQLERDENGIICGSLPLVATLLVRKGSEEREAPTSPTIVKLIFDGLSDVFTFNTDVPQFVISETDHNELIPLLNEQGLTGLSMAFIMAGDILTYRLPVVSVTDNETLERAVEKVGAELFLSKHNDDTAAGFITFLKGLQVGANFVPDILGEGGVLRMREDGKVELVTDILYARMRAYFDSVVIREYRHESGNRIKSPAQGFNASRVEYIKVVDNVETIVDDASEADYFRCYWRVDDGEKKAENQFIVGDLAFCEHSDIVNGSLVTKRYWRVVTGRNAGNTTTDDGEAWIDLSNAHDANGNPVMTTISWEGQGGTTQTLSVKSFESSTNSYPEVHDDICMLGCVVDTTRQGAIIEYVSGIDAPTYQIYQGLGADASNPYSLSNKNQIGFGYNTSTGRAYLNVYGDFRFGARPNTQGSYIAYNQQTGNLDIKANVTFTNVSEMSQFVKDNQNNYDDSAVKADIALLDATTQDLQKQIDGAIETYYMEGVPALNLPPVVSTEEHPYDNPWLDGTETPEERTKILNSHSGDLYYNKATGHGYRFMFDDENNVYVWGILTDEDVAKALADAAKAQETADGKRTIYSVWGAWVKKNVNTLEVGDLFIPTDNTTQGGVTYKANKVYKCTTDGSATFQAADYIDDAQAQAKVDAFVNGTYATDKINLQSQIDGKAETFRQATDPSLDWYVEEGGEVALDVRANHVGDLWMDISANGGKKTYIYEDNGESADPRYEWKAQEVPDEVFDEIDGKSTIFGNAINTPPTNYKKDDMWLLPAAATINGVSYKAGEVLSASQDSKTYSETHWSKKVRYTDDTKADSILNNKYYKQLAGGTINGLIGEAQHAADAAAGTADAALLSAAAANTKLTNWADDGKISPTEKLALKNQKADVQKEYAQIITDAAKYSGVSTTAFTTAYNRAITAFDYYTSTDTEDIDIITDEEEDSDATPRYSRIAVYYAARQTILEAITTAAKNYATAQGDKFLNNAVYKAISAALGSKTDIAGGLVLTSMIGMRQNTGTAQEPSYKVWGGISGEYNADVLGGGIAAWYGGDILDKETLTAEQIAQGWDTLRWAKSIDRFDGSGYRANGNITWNEQGQLVIKNITTLSDSNNKNILNELATFNSAFTFGTSGQGSTTALYITPQVPFESLYIGTSNDNKKEVATQEWVGNNYVSTAFFRQLFRAFKPNETAGQADVEVQPNTIDATISNIKAMVGLWTEQYISALGNSSDGGGGGQGDVTWALLASNQDTRQIAISHLSDTNGVLDILTGYTTSGKNYKVQKDANNHLYVNVPWSEGSDTKNTAGTTNKAATKLFLVGAESQAANPQTYSNANVYIGTDNCLYSNGTKVLTGHQTLYTLSVYGGTTKVLDFKPNANASLYIKAGGNISLTNDTTNKYITLSYSHPTDGADTTISDANGKVLSAITVNNLGHVTSVSSKTLASADIPNLAASKITSGTFDSARIPSLAISKITNLQTSLDAKVDLSSTEQTIESTISSLSKGVIEFYRAVSGGYSMVSFANKDADGTKQRLGYLGFQNEKDVPYFRNTSGTNYKLWHEGNDGSDSGLDADKLDGQHGSYYATASSVTTLQSYFTNGVAKSAAKLTTVSKTAWGQTFWTSGGVPTSISGALSSVTNITMSGYIKIGDAYLAYDSTNNAIKLYKLDANNQEIAANFYALGAISALGQGVDGGGGGGQGDVTWALLASSSDTRQIALSHLTTALSGYSTTSHTHTTTIATDSGTNQLTLAYGTKYKITAGGTSFVFTMPSADDTNTWRNIYVAGTQQITTAVNTKGLNFAAGNNVSLSFAAAGTGSGQSGNANYGTLTINATDTTYSAGTGLSLSNGSFSINSTYQSYISHGESAYNSLSNYLPLSGGTLTGNLKVKYANAAIDIINSTYAVGNNQSVNFHTSTSDQDSVTMYIRANASNAGSDADGGNNSLNIRNTRGGLYLYSTNGLYYNGNTVLDSNNSSVSKSGETLTVKINGTSQSLTNTWRGIQDNLTSSSNTTESLSAKQGYLLANGSARDNTKLPLTGGTLTGTLTARDVVVQSAYTLKIGDAILKWESKNNALKLYKLSGSSEVAVNFYATGGVSALGMSEDGSAGAGDVTWALLRSNDDERPIAWSHISDAVTAQGYATQSWVTSNFNKYVLPTATTSALGGIKVGYTTSGKNYKVQVDASGNAFVNVPWQAGTGTVTSVKVGTTSYTPTNGVVSLPAYPTSLPASDVYSWAKQSTKPSYTLDEVSDGSTRKLANYLPKSGGTMTGVLTLWGSQYNAYDTGNGALNLNNSDITGVNSILTADLSDSWKESIGFKRTNGNYDTFRAADGIFYFGVNNGTEYTALHSGNSSVSKSGETLTVKINGTSQSLTNTNTTYSAGTGLSLSGTTFKIKELSSGAWFSGTAYVGGDGVMEIGRFIDFHPTSSSTLDFNIRLDAGAGTTARTFTFPDSAGTLLSSGNSSVSKSGETLTVKINGTSQSLTNTNTTYSAGSGLSLSGTTFSIASNVLVQGSVIDTHYNGNGTVTLDGTNELYAFYDRGGTCDAYEVEQSATLTNQTLTRTSTAVAKLSANVFNGMVGYNQTDGIYSGEKFAVYDLALPASYPYGANFFWSFGNGKWKPAKMRVLVGKYSASGFTYISKYSTDSCPAYGKVSVGNGETGFNRLRIVVSKYSRLACFGVTFYDSRGLRTTFMNRCLDDAVYRNISPAKDNTWSLGTSSLRWKEVRAVNLYGALTGNASTATKATQDSDGNAINTTYLKLSGGTIVSGSFSPLFIQRNSTTNYAAIGFKHYSSGTTVEAMGYLAIGSKDGKFLRVKGSDTSVVYSILDSSDTSVSKSGETLTVKINGTSQSLTNTNTWRGIQDNLTSSSNTTESLSAKQGYLLANGSARDNTKLPLAGGTMTGSITLNNAVYLYGKNTVGTSYILAGLNADNNFLLGYGTAGAGYSTFLDGNNIYLRYGTSRTTGFYLNSSGNVGIGTTSPSYKLHVVGNVCANGDISVSGDISNTYYMLGGSSSNPFLKLIESTNSKTWYIQGYQGYLYLGVSISSSSAVRIDSSGNLYSPAGISCLASTSSSDIRMKDVQGNVNLNVEQVADAPAVRFLWKKDHSLGMQAGSIAQYWQNVLPETIKEDKEGILSMNYGVAALVAAITTARKVVDHEKEIAQLKNRVKALEDENEMLKTKLIA